METDLQSRGRSDHTQARVRTLEGVNSCLDHMEFGRRHESPRSSRSGNLRLQRHSPLAPVETAFETLRTAEHERSFERHKPPHANDPLRQLEYVVAFFERQSACCAFHCQWQGAGDSRRKSQAARTRSLSARTAYPRYPWRPPILSGPSVRCRELALLTVLPRRIARRSSSSERQGVQDS